jgi:hypothetical protein
MFVDEHDNASVEWLGSQTFRHEPDRAIAVKDQEPDGHFERVESGRGQLVDADQLVGSPFVIFALPGEAVPDRHPVARQVAHETKRADKASEVAAKVDDQARAA